MTDPQPPPNSKLAGASMICFIVSVPVALIAWEARGTDHDWIAPVGGVAAAVLFVCSNALAAIALAVITGSGGRVRGIGYAVAALALNVAAVVAGVVMLLISAGSRR